MKTKFPDYKRIGTAKIKKSLKPKDKKLLADFLEFCAITAGDKKLKIIERIMLQFHDVAEKPYSSISLKDLRGFLAVLNNSSKSTETRNDIKKTLKRYLKWHFKNWNEKFNSLADIKTQNGFNEEKINPSTLLKSEELEKLIRGAESLRHKALIILMYESGGRPEEILKLRWNDIDLARKEVKLHSSKTSKTRVNPLSESILHLERYKQEYPFLNVRTDDYVFPSPEDRKKHVTVNALDDYLKKLSHKVLGRGIFPYLIRHTRLTQIHKTLPTQVACKFAGHSPEMAKRYTHLTNDDVREAMLEKIYHIEELTVEDKEQLKSLKDEIETLKTGNRNQTQKISQMTSDNSQNYKLLKKLNLIVHVLLKAASKDKKTEAYFKKQLCQVMSKEEISFH